MLQVGSGFKRMSKHHLPRSMQRRDEYLSIIAGAKNPSHAVKLIQVFGANKQVFHSQGKLMEFANVIFLGWKSYGICESFGKICPYLLQTSRTCLLFYANIGYAHAYTKTQTKQILWLFFGYILSNYYCTIR